MTTITAKILFVVLISQLVGCSYLSYDASRDEMLKNRIYASGDKKAMCYLDRGMAPRAAIRAVTMDSGLPGIGIDLSSLDVIMQHPFRQVGAAVLDAAAIYGAYQGVKSFTDNSSHSSANTAGRDNNNVNVNGSGNNVNIGNSKDDHSQ